MLSFRQARLVRTIMAKNFIQADSYGWYAYTLNIQAIMRSLSVHCHIDGLIDVDNGFQLWTEKAFEIKRTENCIYLIGNGASASMSSHFAADINKNVDIHTQVFTDLALITALANDISYAEVFAQPLNKRAKPGDMLVTISSSGRSPNILRAIEVAKEMGLYVVTVSAMKEDNPSRQLGHLNFFIPASTYGLAETAHAAILHYWTDLLVDNNDQFKKNRL